MTTDRSSAAKRGEPVPEPVVNALDIMLVRSSSEPSTDDDWRERIMDAQAAAAERPIPEGE